MDIPVMRSAHEVSAWALRVQPDLAADDVETLCVRVGRDEAPFLLATLWDEGALSVEALRMVSVVWAMAEYPESALGIEEWEGLFEAAGYTVDGHAAPRPTQALRLYRGAAPERRDGWSWTDDPRVAADYASGDRYQRPEGRVWTAEVPPQRLLCRNTERQESEYVVDTTGLIITAFEEDSSSLAQPV